MHAWKADGKTIAKHFLLLWEENCEYLGDELRTICSSQVILQKGRYDLNKPIKGFFHKSE